jgi:hypothetical protein
MTHRRAGARLSAGGWDETVRRLSAVLPDEKILAEVIDFLRSHGEAVPGGERYASAEQLYIQEKTVVCSKEQEGGIVLYATVFLGPRFSDGRFTGGSSGGRLKVMYDAEGSWLDEFHTPGW